jgi:uncharacterized protein (TIGR02996 family)
MTHEEAFLEDIREHPDDDAPRLIFADWLEENGDPDRAEFIRLMIAAATNPSTSSNPGGDRTWRLLERNWDRWVVPIKASPQHEPWIKSTPTPAALPKFCRGFISELAYTTGQFLKDWGTVRRLTCLTTLRLLGNAGSGQGIARCPALADLRRLDFIDYYRSPLGWADMVALATVAKFRKLQELRLYQNNIGDRGLAAMARAPWLSSVILLDVGDNGIGRDGLATLANSSGAPALRILNLAHNPIGDAGARLLADAPWLGQLQYLDLSSTGVTAAGVDLLRERAPRLEMRTGPSLRVYRP